MSLVNHHHHLLELLLVSGLTGYGWTSGCSINNIRLKGCEQTLLSWSGFKRAHLGALKIYCKLSGLFFTLRLFKLFISKARMFPLLFCRAQQNLPRVWSRGADHQGREPSLLFSSPFISKFCDLIKGF